MGEDFNPVTIQEIPYGEIPVSVVSGTPMNTVTILFTTAGVFPMSDIAVKAGVDITVELWGAGGGGGGMSTGSTPGAYGGSSGGYICAVVPADIWAAGGSLNIPSPASGGTSSGATGGSGEKCYLYGDGLGSTLMRASGGPGGKPHDGGSSPGGGVFAADGLVVISSTEGNPTPAPAGDIGGPGASCPGVGGGIGGKGGSNAPGGNATGFGAGGGGGGKGSTSHHGGLSGGGKARLTFAV
jgi:hypothetical protein